MKTKSDLFSEILREIEVEIGTRDLATMVLEALIDSVRNLNVDDKDEFFEQFESVREFVSNTDPKYGILLNFFNKFSRKFKNLNKNKWRKESIKMINDVLKINRKQNREIFKYADKINVEGKTIFIHDNSHSVHDVLKCFKRSGKHFRVIVEERDYYRTQDSIEVLHNAGIPFTVVPSYMVSHVIDEIDMLFFGAVTLKDTMNFVVSPGTHAVITEFLESGIPSYIFINTNKFSYWKSKDRKEIFIHKHKRTHSMKAIEYDRIKYSHDRVPAKLFNKIVTNQGIFDPKGVKKLFEKGFKLAK